MAKVCLRMLENPWVAFPLECKGGYFASGNFFAKLISEISLPRNLLAQFQREETQLFVLRVMVGLVILYDHVHPQGAFVKGSNVDVSMKKKNSADYEYDNIISRF